jgi:hypothetical protein
MIWAQIVKEFAKEAAMPIVKEKVKVVLTGTKFCNGCNQVKNKTEFYPKRTRSINSVSSKCKECSKKNVKKIKETKTYR